uniref:Uncharacterized protein n=1 Tax=Eutreptiella gymnastica TaxID=73025 RepID=A0A7S4LLQ4_9EUGL
MRAPVQHVEPRLRPPKPNVQESTGATDTVLTAEETLAGRPAARMDQGEGLGCRAAWPVALSAGRQNVLQSGARPLGGTDSQERAPASSFAAPVEHSTLTSASEIVEIVTLLC